jgi:PEP-CTERM motif
MHVKKLLLTTVAVLLLITGAAFADSIDFSFSGSNSSSTWSWAGGSSTLSASASSASVGLVGGSSIPINGDVLVSFTSGLGMGGAGSLTDPYTFGPSAAGSIVIDGCLPGLGGGCTTVTLFSGQFNSGELAVTGNGNFNFDGVDVSGTINPGVASYFGFQNDNVNGSLDAILTCGSGTYGCSTGWSGVVGSGDLVLSPGSGGTPPIPEPSSLFLMGSGVLALGTFLRTRRRS